jgi:hypothetical protein
VTEAEWLAATDPEPMLKFLRGGAISARKRRLFACWCCRLIWQRLPSAAWRHAVEVTARTVDGRATDADRQAAVLAANPPLIAEFADRGQHPRADHSLAAAMRATYRDASHANALATAVHTASADPSTRPRQADLLRELVGNPFRRRDALDPEWLAWNDGAVLMVATAAYKGRDLSALFLVADALEDAGCTDAELLSHLREPGPHVRGCWAVDHILGGKRK